MKLENKVLIIFPYEGRKNAGGPEGFISQLIRPFKLPDIEVTPPIEHKISSRWKRLISQPWTLASPTNLWQGIKNPRHFLNHTVFQQAGMTSARFLWFMHHGLYEQFAPFIRPEQGVIYQPHCPELPWMEILGSDDSAVGQRRSEEASVRNLMKRSNMLVLPNEGTRSIYDTLINPSLEVHYIQSGAAAPADVGSIPLDSRYTYLLYIGRRLPIKGFDVVMEAFAQARSIRDDLRLVICGSGEPVREAGVIDIGFSSCIHDWIASVDCVVNTNRQSYLDLSVMETLAIGTPIVMTATHGHEIFHQFQSPALHCLTTPEPSELARRMTEVRRKDREQPHESTLNHQVYEQEFSIPKYHKRLIEFANHVLLK